MTSLLRFVATCVPGAEKWAARELNTLEVATTYEPGAVQGRASLVDVRRILTESRLIESLRVRPVQSFKAASFEDLCRGVAKVPWHAYLVVGLPLEVRVTCSKSRLYHSDAVGERVWAVVRDRTRREWQPPAQLSINNYCNRVYVRIEHDEVELGVDTAGEALHRRGYRTHVGEAPLRETLAALLSEIAADASNQPITRVWDPCCGSGTIPLEWIRKQFHRGAKRRFLMDEWPCFTTRQNQALAAEDSFPGSPVVFGSDVSARAVEAARVNADNLGALAACRFEVCDFGEFERQVPDGTAVFTNLPYGVRLDTQELARGLFRRLDQVLARRAALRPAVVLWGGGKQVPRLENGWQPVLHLKNGGLPVTVFLLR